MMKVSSGFRVQQEIAVEYNQPLADPRKVRQLELSLLAFETDRASLALRRVITDGELQICQVGNG